MIGNAVAIGVLLSVLSASASGQGCCTAGVSGQGGIDRGVQRTGLLSLTANYQSLTLDRTYETRELIPDPQNRIADASFLTVQAEYGLVPGVSVLASYSYSAKSRELTATRGQGSSMETEVASYRASGWGDLLLLAKYDLIGPTLLTPFEFSLGGGALLPTGSTNEEREGTRLSQDLQPGSGTPSLLLWFFSGMKVRDPGLSFSVTGSYRYAGTNLDGYRAGDEIVMTLGAELAINQNFGVSLPVRGRFQKKDFSNRRVLSGTGGTFWDLMPALIYYEGNAVARVFGSLPLYRNVSGIQMTPGFGIGAEVSYAITLK
jgi:hypothetical protein